jgi:hypothetical protein
VRKNEYTLVLYNSEALYIIKIEWNISDYGDKLIGFQMVFTVNATKTQKVTTP